MLQSWREKNIRRQKRNPSNLELSLIFDVTHCWCNHVWFLRVLRTLSALWTMLEPSSNFLRRTSRGWSCAPQGVEGNRSSVMMKHLDIRRNPFPVSVITWLLTVLWKKRAKSDYTLEATQFQGGHITSQENVHNNNSEILQKRRGSAGLPDSSS